MRRSGRHVLWEPPAQQGTEEGSGKFREFIWCGAQKERVAPCLESMKSAHKCWFEGTGLANLRLVQTSYFLQTRKKSFLFEPAFGEAGQSSGTKQ